MQETVEVCMGEVRVERDPVVLRTNLGSCVGVVLYDPVAKWGGLAHIVSPESIQELGKVSTSYADIAIPTLLDMMFEKGCLKNNIVCTIGGGGCMFEGASGIMDIGKKNIEAVKNHLSAEKIRIQKMDVGGPYSTVMVFDTASGTVEFERRKSDLKVAITREKDYKQAWVDQNAQHVTLFCAHVKTKQFEYMEKGTSKIDPQKLMEIVRSYAAVNKISRLVGYMVYTKIISDTKV